MIAIVASNAVASALSPPAQACESTAIGAALPNLTARFASHRKNKVSINFSDSDGVFSENGPCDTGDGAGVRTFIGWIDVANRYGKLVRDSAKIPFPDNPAGNPYQTVNPETVAIPLTRRYTCDPGPSRRKWEPVVEVEWEPTDGPPVTATYHSLQPQFVTPEC